MMKPLFRKYAAWRCNPNMTSKGAKACAATVATLIGLSTATPALAASGSVYFGGDITVSAACVVIVRDPGTLAPSADGHQLSSKLPGGSQGTADIYSIRRYDVSVSAPGFFSTAPQGGNDNVTFTATFSGQSIFRGLTFPERPGDNAIELDSGFTATRLFVDVVADRTNVFPAGNYSTQATVRCE